MDETRIYEQCVAIDTAHVREFYDRRAKAFDQGDTGAVLLGSQDTEILAQKNRFEQQEILPLLDTGRQTRVLDLGCGIGRWAEFLMPGCGFYCGIDFSPEMAGRSAETCRRLGMHFQVSCMSVLEAVLHGPSFWGGRFGSVIAAGVFVYLNDAELSQVFSGLPELLEERCTVYLTEPVGVSRRLTLREFPSDALQSDYNAIYRTPEEYAHFARPLLDAGFSVAEQGFMPRFGESYTDTARYYAVLKRP